jgi:hypothetical protein
MTRNEEDAPPVKGTWSAPTLTRLNDQQTHGGGPSTNWTEVSGGTMIYVPAFMRTSIVGALTYSNGQSGAS